MTHDSIILVIAAHRDGKEIQWRHKEDKNGKWIDEKASGFLWMFYSLEYRIKPKPREWRVCLNSLSETKADIFVPIDGITPHDECPHCIHVIEVLPSSGESAST